MTWYDVVVFENVWEVLECAMYTTPVIALMAASIWYLVKKTSFEN